MKRTDKAAEVYFAISETFPDAWAGDFVVVADAEGDDSPAGLAVSLGTLATSGVRVPLYYLVVAGRELPGTWARRGRAFVRGGTPPAGARADGYRGIRRMIAASSAR